MKININEIKSFLSKISKQSILISIIIIIFIPLIIISFIIWKNNLIDNLKSYNSIELNSAKTDNEIDSKVVNKSDVLKILTNAEIYFNNNELELALIEYKKLLINWYWNIPILTKIVEIQIRLQQFNDALYTYTVLLKVINNNEIFSWKEIKDNNEIFTWKEIKDNNLTQNIIEKWNNLNNKDPNSDLSEYFLELAKLHFDAFDYYYEENVQKNYYAIIYNYLLTLHSLDIAESYNPNIADIYYYRGKILMDIWSFDDTAEKEFKKAIELKKDDFNYYYRLWNSLNEQKKYEEAILVYLKWIELNDKYEKLYLNIWNAYYDLWKNEKTLEYYNKWIAICSEMCSSFYYNIWNHLFYDEKYVESIPYLDKAIELNNNEIKAYSIRWQALFYINKYDLAKKDLEHIIKNNYNINIWYYYLGIILQIEWKYEQAISNFDKISETDYNYKNAEFKIDEIKKLQNNKVNIPFWKQKVSIINIHSGDWILSDKNILDVNNINMSNFRIVFDSNVFLPSNNLKYQYEWYKYISKINLYYNNLDNNDILVWYGLPFINSNGDFQENFWKWEKFSWGYEQLVNNFISVLEIIKSYNHPNIWDILPNNKQINIKIWIVDYYWNEYKSDNFKIKIEPNSSSKSTNTWILDI